MSKVHFESRSVAELVSVRPFVFVTVTIGAAFSPLFHIFYSSLQTAMGSERSLHPLLPTGWSENGGTVYNE